jgi:hypothetical protein
MKKYLMAGMLILCTEVFSYGQMAEERQVVDLAKRKFQWIIHNRTDSLETILDDRLQYIHSTGWVQTKKDVLVDFKSGKLSYQSIDIKEISARVYEKTAIVTGRGKFSGINAGSPFSVDLMFTEVYILKNTGWQLVSRHANKML